jgi:hypothetical protein
MKKMLKTLLILCCFAMLLGMVACKPQTEGPDEGDEKPQTDMMLDAEGNFRYTVVRPDNGSDSDKKAAISLRQALAAKYNAEIDISDDWVDDPNATDEDIANYYEILVGLTKRPESVAAEAELADYTYTIRVVGNKIVIVGKDEKATALAVQYFIDTYLADPVQITSTLNYTGVYEVHPLDVVLGKDKSTGKTNPRVVKTQYATEDVVIADIIVTEDGYAVSNNGMGDSTKGIQKALDDCSKNGGGTVFLPAGVYAISGSIQIPPYVTLRGDWQDPDEGTGYGTVIFIYGEGDEKYKPGAEVTEGTFMLGGSGGVMGLTVYYPDQSLDNVKNYPFTFYTDGNGNNYMLSTVKNVTVLNGFRGIGACCLTKGGAHEQLTVENFKGTFLYCGAEVYNQADVGTWQDVVIANKYWTNAKGDKIQAADAEALGKYTKRNTVGLKLGDLEWTEFESLKVSDCSIGIEIMVGKRIQFAGSLYDIEILNCKKGMHIHQLDLRWGMVIARSTIENGIYNESYRNNAGGTPGMVKLVDVKTTGALKGEITQLEGTLTDYEVDFKRSYVKPTAKLYVATLDKSGESDVSAALQAKLDEAGVTGGIVYLPGGTYRLDQPINVPAGVELRGSSAVATRDQGWRCRGTMLQCYYGDDESSTTADRAFITLAGDYAGINGIRIVYPENGPYDSNLNTTYTVRGQGKGVYMVNSMIAASAYGVDFRGCDEHFIKKVSTCCYYNTFLLGGENGMLSGCLQNGTVLCRTSAPHLQNWLAEGNVFTDLFDPITRQKNLYIVLEGATDQQIYNTFVYGCATMITCNDSTALVVNVGSDNIGRKTPQMIMNSGKMVIINSMRYNGTSYSHNGGTLEMYNRLTINDKHEATYNQSK